MFVPIALSKDLPPKRVMRAVVDDQDLVVWRSTSGQLSVWHNRCPHRGMRLSHGFVRGEALACLYHGWHYDKKGQCRYIPAHPELEPPASIRTEVFQLVEQGGLIWASVNGNDAVAELSVDLKPIRTMDFDCSVDVLEANLLTEACQGISPLGSYNARPYLLADQKISGFEILNEMNNLKVLLFLQKPSPETILVHILAAADFDQKACIALSRWLEAVRRNAEQVGKKVQSL